MDEIARISAIAGPAPSEFPSTPRFLGIVMLQTRFPRPVGDIGNPASFALPVRSLVVEGALPHKVVQSAQALRESGLMDAFREAVRQLDSQGAAAVTTSCGFLVLLQQAMQAAARAPVITSSLLMLPRLLAQNRQVGVLTISATNLGAEYLEAAGVDKDRLADVLVQGVPPNGEFASSILGNRDSMNLETAARELVGAALLLKERAPHLTDVVLECTNMPPYAREIEQATGWRTWSLLQAPELVEFA